MGSAKLTTVQDISPNNRNAYVSLLDMLSWCAFTTFDFLRQRTGVSIKWTCDGTTGPANAADATNRITDRTKFQTRATIAGAAQSYFVLDFTDFQLMYCYQGASDDICRISVSPSKSFTLAGTTTQQPTATDEVVIMLGGVSSATSLDRVMTIWGSATMFSVIIWRSSTVVNYFGYEKGINLASTRAINPVWTGAVNPPYFGYRLTTMTRTYNSIGGPMGCISNQGLGTANYLGYMARVYTDSARTIKAAMAYPEPPPNTNSTKFSSDTCLTVASKPALQNGEGYVLFVPVIYGEKAANSDGVLGTPIDWWVALGNSYTADPAVVQPMDGWDPTDDTGVVPARSNWLIAICPAIVRQWRNVAATMEIA